MSELAIRSVVGVALVAAALALVWLGGWVLAISAGLLACLMYAEWRRLVKGWGLGWDVAGFVYSAVPALSLLLLREQGSRGLDLVLWTFIVTWSTDIGAYFAGRAIGGPKLAPAISPNKTIAGLVGGVLSATALGYAWADYAELPNILYVAAPIFAAAAQGGDLFESWMKRRAGVKDSGTLLPGHGGALDRLDGLVVVLTLTAGLFLAGALQG